MKHITVSQAVQATGGRYFGSENDLGREISFACSDSRTVREGTLFAALTCGMMVKAWSKRLGGPLARWFEGK